MRASFARWCLPAVLTPAALVAATFHVSPGGDDAASGEARAPFQTIQRAVEAARAGDTVLLHEGIYRETIRPEHDGRADAPITLAAAPGARPIVSALDPITGPWVFDGNGRYSAIVPAVPALGKVANGVAPALSTGQDQIFIDGIEQPEARHPNRSGGDPLDHEGLALKVDANFRITAPELARLPDNALAGARFHGHVHPGWTAQSGVVASSGADEVRMDPATLSTPWWPNRARSGGIVDADATYSPVYSEGSGYFFGALALLDAEGEWIIERRATGDTLRLCPPGGRHPASLHIERKVRPWTIDLDGRSHWIIRALRLVGGAVRLRGEHLVLDHCEIRHPTHFLTFAHGYDYDGGLPQGGAILLEGRQSTVRACVIRASGGSGIILKGEGHRVSRNQLHDIDYSGTYAAGVTVGGHGHVVEFNTIRETGRDAIALAGGGHRILYNDLSRAGRLAMDGGGLYTYGQNGADRATGHPTEIAYNWVHESGQPDDPKNRGIYIDNYSRGFVVHHNVLWGLGHPGKNKGLHLGAPSIDVAFYHNTLIEVLPPTEASYTKFPLTNRDPEFWTAANNRLVYRYQNNLHLPATIAPEMVLENPKSGDYRPRAGSFGVDPATTESLKVWQTSDGRTGVPADYTLYVQDESVPFSFYETSGQGVSLPGINDGFTGTSPDDGAYERGLPLWRPGHEGFTGGDFRLIQDIPFLGSDRAEKLDAYVPVANARESRPAVIMIHGGGWSGGDKTDSRIRDAADSFTAKGYVVFSINYDLVKYRKEQGKIIYPIDHDAFPQNIEDCRAALRWVRQNAAAYQVDPEKIALLGFSAGAHLALQVGMTSGTDAGASSADAKSDDRVSGVIALYGPTNLAWFGRHMFHGETAYKIVKYSPINAIASDMPPLLILHGTDDETVDIQDSRRFVEALKQFEATQGIRLDYRFVEVEGGKHSFPLSPHPSNRNTDLREQVLAFLRSVFEKRR